MLQKLTFCVILLSAFVGGAVCSGEPPSELVVYTALRPANWDLYAFQKPGHKPKRLTTHEALDYNPAVSPDGRWLVFCSERRGDPDLWVIDLDNSGPPRLLIDSHAMEDAPAFSPDGRRLVFVSSRDGNADIFVVPFSPNKTIDRSGAASTESIWKISDKVVVHSAAGCVI